MKQSDVIRRKGGEGQSKREVGGLRNIGKDRETQATKRKKRSETPKMKIRE